MLRLGGSVVPVSASSSSVKKGETLGDTMKTMGCYCDAIVLRHPATGSAIEAANAVDVPVLNAGDGAGEHPTQALLDLVTICAERAAAFVPASKSPPTVQQSVNGLHVVLVGDLKHGRTVHSLAKLLSLFCAGETGTGTGTGAGAGAGSKKVGEAPKLRLTFVAPDGLGMPAEVVDSIRARGCSCSSSPTLEACISEADVVYVTRVQKERFKTPEAYAAA